MALRNRYIYCKNNAKRWCCMLLLKLAGKKTKGLVNSPAVTIGGSAKPSNTMNQFVYTRLGFGDKLSQMVNVDSPKGGCKHIAQLDLVAKRGGHNMESSLTLRDISWKTIGFFKLMTLVFRVLAQNVCVEKRCTANFSSIRRRHYLSTTADRFDKSKETVTKCTKIDKYENSLLSDKSLKNKDGAKHITGDYTNTLFAGKNTSSREAISVNSLEVRQKRERQNVRAKEKFVVAEIRSSYSDILARSKLNRNYVRLDYSKNLIKNNKSKITNYGTDNRSCLLQSFVNVTPSEVTGSQLNMSIGLGSRLTGNIYSAERYLFSSPPVCDASRLVTPLGKRTIYMERSTNSEPGTRNWDDKTIELEQFRRSEERFEKSPILSKCDPVSSTDVPNREGDSGMVSSGSNRARAAEEKCSTDKLLARDKYIGSQMYTCKGFIDESLKMKAKSVMQCNLAGRGFHRHQSINDYLNERSKTDDYDEMKMLSTAVVKRLKGNVNNRLTPGFDEKGFSIAAQKDSKSQSKQLVNLLSMSSKVSKVKSAPNVCTERTTMLKSRNGISDVKHGMPSKSDTLLYRNVEQKKPLLCTRLNFSSEKMGACEKENNCLTTNTKNKLYTFSLKVPEQKDRLQLFRDHNNQSARKDTGVYSNHDTPRNTLPKKRSLENYKVGFVYKERACPDHMKGTKNNQFNVEKKSVAFPETTIEMKPVVSRLDENKYLTACKYLKQMSAPKDLGKSFKSRKKRTLFDLVRASPNRNFSARNETTFKHGSAGDQTFCSAVQSTGKGMSYLKQSEDQKYNSLSVKSKAPIKTSRLANLISDPKATY